MSSMIDWISGRFRYSFDGRINDGTVMRVSPDGVIEWSSDAWLQVEGSYSSSIRLRGTGVDGVGWLYFSGNPAKFLQGHNLFGTNDLQVLMRRFLDALVSRLDLTPTADDLASWSAGDYWLTRLDITRMYDLGSDDRVRQFLGAALPVASAKHQRTSVAGSTVYVGQHSKRKSVKFYNKLEEMKVHKLPDTLPVDIGVELRNYATGAVRVEATLRSMELQRLGLLRYGRWWDERMVESYMDIAVGGVELNDVMKLDDELVGTLPGKLVAVYDAWRAGRDLRSVYSKNTFYKYRRQLLVHGVDIAHVRPREVVSKTQYLLDVPLRSLLAGAGKEPPTWARGTQWLISA